jgi:hypothetical protein
MRNLLRFGTAALLTIALLFASTTAHAQDDEEASPSPLPLVVAGGGVLLLGLGVLFGMQASGARDDARAADEHAMALEHTDSAQSLTSLSNVCYLFGASLLVAGIGWYSVELTDAQQANEVALSIGPGTLALRGAF